MQMKLVIHDCDQDSIPIKGDMYITLNGEISNCIGCFGCWIKTPGQCIIRDDYGDMGEYLGKCDELIIVSKCFYGGYSPFIKNVLDRSISYIHPYFEIRNGEMHHKSRYKNKIDLKVIFYGENISEKERQTVEKLVEANGINLNCKDYKVFFVNNLNELEGVLI